jgi:excisionase family DNA binding protein
MDNIELKPVNSKKETAAYLNVCEKTLDRWRQGGKLRWAKLGGLVMFRREDILEFVGKALRLGFPSI